MISLQISAPGKIRIIDSVKPGITKDDVLIKVKYAGFCGSDLSSYQGRNPMVKYPVIPGHEIAGIIEQKGKSVPQDIKIGHRVTIIPYTSCGKCASCLRGRPNACKFNETMGVQRDGAMSEYISVPWQKVLFGSGLSMECLAITEPLTVGFHAVSRGRVTQNDTVVVLGCGIIGIGAIISAVARKARVVAVDVDDKKLEIAMNIGAADSINAKKLDLAGSLSDLGQGHGPDVIIEAAGQPATYLAAVEGVAFTGRVVCIGYAKENIAFATKLFVQKELDILGSRNASREDFDEVTDFLDSGRIDTAKLISMVVSPRQAPEAMKKWAENPAEIFKILVEFH